MKVKISETLKELPRVDYRKLVGLQGSLKDLDEANYNKLRNSFRAEGFFVPLFVWRDGTENEIYLLDGHQRVTVMRGEEVQATGEENPFEFPCVFIDAPTKQRAAEKLLIITSKFGKVTQEGWDWFQEAFEIETDFVIDMTGFDGFVVQEEVDMPDYSGRNQEIDVDDFEDKCVLKLEYTLEEYNQVKSSLSQVAATPEQAVWQLLKLPEHAEV